MFQRFLVLTIFFSFFVTGKSLCDSLEIIVSYSHPTCPGFCDGSVNVSTTGATGLVDGEVTDAGGFLVMTGLGTCPNPLCAGWYYIHVSDEAGCEISDSVLLVEPDEMEIILNVTMPSSQSACDGIAEVDTVLYYSGAYSNLGFYWSPGGPNGIAQTLKSDLCYGDYSLIVNNEVGCEAVLNFTVGNLSSKENSTTNTLIIFPNPANEWLVITSTSLVDEITIFDLSGNEVMQISVTETNKLIDIQYLPVGFYFLKVRTGEYFEYWTFVKSNS